MPVLVKVDQGVFAGVCDGRIDLRDSLYERSPIQTGPSMGVGGMFKEGLCNDLGTSELKAALEAGD